MLTPVLSTSEAQLTEAQALPLKSCLAGHGGAYLLSPHSGGSLSQGHSGLHSKFQASQDSVERPCVW